MTRSDDLLARKAELENLRKANKSLLGALREEMSALQSTESKLNSEIDKIHNELAKGKEAPRVSDHAVIRYLERERGFDFEEVRKSLLTPTVLAAMDMNAQGVKIQGGTLKLSGKTVTTFVVQGFRDGKKPKAKRKSVTA